jgi:hypothetical protein
MDVELLVRAWRLLNVSLGCWDIGAAGYIVWAYLRGHVATVKPYRVRSHVIAMVASYLMLAGLLVGVSAGRALTESPEPFNILVPFATIAFGLGAYALWEMSFSKKEGA